MNVRDIIVRGLAGLVASLSLLGAVAHATDQGSNVRYRRIVIDGARTCAEDARLVPDRSEGYDADMPGGWVYRCKNFDAPGKFAR